MKVSLIVPVWNEEKRLKHSIIKILKYCDKKLEDYELIIVDDGSSDNTAKIVRTCSNNKIILLQNKINMGKGYSVKKGILSAKYPYVLFLDCDLATPIEELDKFITYANDGYDIVIASRNLKESKIISKQPKYRQWLGKIFSVLVQCIAIRGFKDTQCGFKLFKTNIAKKIVSLQTFNRFSFDVELLYIAKKMNLKIKEAPVTWYDKDGSTVRIWKDTSRMLTDLFRIKLNNFKGKYKLNK
jgi:dolichyl-phosphate beta-glucosyltransferase